MVPLALTPRPWIRRLDHVICRVPSIREAMDLFVNRLGFPEAWPIGPFWPGALTSGVAIGGLNLEFVELRSSSKESGDSPISNTGNQDAVARITTLVFEPIDLDLAARRYDQMNFPMHLQEKWEPDPELLRLRGFEDVEEPQLICRNLVPHHPGAFDFFLCDYAPLLSHRLSPEQFAVPFPIKEIVLSGPREVVPFMNTKFPLGMKRSEPVILFAESDGPAEVVEFKSERGPLDFEGWPATFRFV